MLHCGFSHSEYLTIELYNISIGRILDIPAVEEILSAVGFVYVAQQLSIKNSIQKFLHEPTLLMGICNLENIFHDELKLGPVTSTLVIQVLL